MKISNIINIFLFLLVSHTISCSEKEIEIKEKGKEEDLIKIPYIKKIVPQSVLLGN